MPKKRFTAQYSKPASTVHPSLSFGAPALSSNRNDDVTPSVNELISSLRNSQVTPDQRARASVTMTRSLPPQIQTILSLPQTPTPRSRGRETRRLYDEEGRRSPAGPPPPKSWLEKTRDARAIARERQDGRLYPDNVDNLPGLENFPPRTILSPVGHNGRGLQDMCLRRMALDWDFIADWEHNNLADIPTRLRMLLLSNVAVYGPLEGVGYENLKALLVPPETSGRGELPDNDSFYRLDISGSIGRSISFKQLAELVENSTQVEDGDAEESWEDTIARSPSPPIPHLTHLSLSHPPRTISWPKLLQFAKLVPTITHLSLAYWPAPSMTPNSVNAVMASPIGKNIQLGGRNLYSHSLDHDFREAASIMRRLAGLLYGLEYLDLSGCTDWAPALRWKGDGEMGVDWSSHWAKLATLKINSGIHLSQHSSHKEVYRYAQGLRNAIGLEFIMHNDRRRSDRRTRVWLEIQRDNHRDYSDLWKGNDGDDKKRRKILDAFDEEDWRWHPNLANPHPRIGELLDLDVDVARRSVWEQ